MPRSAVDRAFADTGGIAPAYVIGIAYPDQTAETWRTLREHDYLHVARSGSQAAAAAEDLSLAYLPRNRRGSGLDGNSRIEGSS